MYTVKILSEKEFNKLPFSKVRERPHDILGASDPKTGIAYVKDTGYNDITKGTIAHELDELMAKVSPHEVDGIRYKDVGEAFGNVGNFAKSVATPVFNTAKTVGSLPFKAVGGLARGAANALKPSGYNKAGGVFDKFSGGSGGSPFQPISGSGGIDNAFANVARGGGPAVPDVFSSAPRQTVGGAASSGGFGGILDKFKGAAADLAPTIASNAIGHFLAPKVSAPDFSGVTDRLREGFETGGFDPELRSAAKGALLQGIAGEGGNVPESAFMRSDQVADEALERDIKSLKEQFKAANPGVNIENNSAFLAAQNEVRSKDRDRRQGLREETEYRYMNDQLARRQEDIRLALNVDQAQMQQLTQLAQLEIEQIMVKTGLEYGEAAEIKQLFQDFGTKLFEGGQNAN